MFIKGLVLASSFVIILGPQNIHVMRRGLIRKNIFFVAISSILSCFLLSIIGVAGVGTLMEKNITIEHISAILGSLVMVWYAFICARRAWNGESFPDISSDSEDKESIPRLMLLTSSLVLFNPLAYLEYFVILGGYSTTLPEADKLSYLVGACTAVFIWFSLLAYGMRFLLPIFRKPRSWQILDSIIALSMVYMAINLLCKMA
jgi:L-lysine exporter family protein LysE/ArgO